MKQKAQIHWLDSLADAAAEQALMSGSVHFAMPPSEPQEIVCASVCVWFHISDSILAPVKGELSLSSH